MDKLEIGTKRLVVRRFCADDWSDMHEYLSDPDVVRYEPYGVFSPEESRQEARRRADDMDYWTVCLRETGKMIGNLYLSRREYRKWELGFVFGRAYQGRGLASESAAALLDHAFSTLGARRIVAMCNPENEKSWRLLERLGMTREGRLRQDAYFKMDDDGNPIWFDTYVYGLLRSEWSVCTRGAGRQGSEMKHEK